MELFLNRNENDDEDIASIISEAISKAALYKYPNYQKFTETLSRFLDISPEYILPTSGCSEAIKISFEAFGTNSCLIKDKTYDYALSLAHSKSSKVSYYYYKEDLFTKLLIQGNPNFIYICSPNNPNGEVFSKQEIEQLLITTLKTNCIVFIDETYFDFCDMELIKLVTIYPNLILGRSFSKAWGCAGLRMGYIVANPLLIKELDKYRLKASINTAGIAAITELIEYNWVIKNSIKKIKTNFEFVSNYIISNNGIILSQNNTNFIYFKHATDCFKHKNIVIKHFDMDYNMIAIPSRESSITRFLTPISEREQIVSSLPQAKDISQDF